MQTKKAKIVNEVHVLTDKTCMKFIPTSFVKQTPKQPPAQAPKPTQSIVNRFSLSSLFGSKKIKSSDQENVRSFQRTESLPINLDELDLRQLQQIRERPQTQRPKIYQLKFAYRLAAEHLIIGNQFQLDVINILGINSNKYVQTEYLWSLKYPNLIEHVSLDQKKQNLLVVVAGKNLIVYKYDSKKITSEPMVPFKEIPLQAIPKHIQVVKDGNICIFYQQKLEILLVGQQIRSRHKKPYQKPEIVINEKYTYNLFMVPQPFDNIVNVFFQAQKNEDDKTFVLWCIQFQFLASQIKASAPQKIYDIKSSFRRTLNLKNYSKQIFLMNLGNQVLALKKGYMLDSATVNLKQEKTQLQYIGNDTLLHISAQKIDAYSFFVNLNVKPHRIIIKSKDSIKINQNSPNDEFFKVINIMTNDLIVIFQKNSEESRSKSGEIQYSFYVTRATSRENKINQLFPINPGQDFRIDDPVLLDKCDMAEKMGLSTKEIYLQLWSRSLQSRKQDYSILIATKDYSTINQQIIRKLKKASMNFKQIQNIEQACFVMLQQKVFSSSCTQEAVMDYISSHFFKRKLEMFRDIQMMEKFQKEKETGNQQKEGFKMTIRQYQQYKSMEIKQQIISLVNLYCHEGKKQLSKNIRFLLRNFKFVFRIIYYDVLEAIIQNANVKLLDLLQQIPELLPYHPPETQSSLHIPTGFFEGVWPQISRQEWNTSLYVDAITTIDNKQIIMEQVIKSISFKRNWLSQHDMVIQSVEKIKANYQKIKSPLTFYFFAAKIFEHINDANALKKIVDFLQSHYQLPQNLKGTIFLNQRLYRFFIQRNIAPQKNGRPYTLTQFFSFEDKQLIRHCFDKQRSNKGLLLKDIKDIFKQVLKDQANQKYNKAILNYFTSDLSEVSDLKYILNRINNQKQQFHRQNQSMYEILVEALERKLKIGTDNDIPIEEVLIYIQNIPLDLGSKPLQELKSVQKIEKQSQMLRAAKVNMSIYDILNNQQEVFSKLANHIIQTAPHQIWQDKIQFQKFAIKNLAVLQIFAEEVYDKNFSQTIFFIFLAKLCEKTERITFADFLLRNDQFKQRVDEETPQVLAYFMYKWKLSSEKQMIKNEQYIKQILKLLPQQSNIHIYIQSEFQFAKIMSAPNNPVTYPISEGYLKSFDVCDMIFDLPAEFVLELDIEKLYMTIYRMQQVLMQTQQMQQNNQFAQEQLITAANRITLHQIYEFVIVKLIHSNKLKQVLPKIKQILDINISDTTYNIVYVIIFIIKISSQLNEQNKNNLTQCISYYFYEPKKLLSILEYILNNPLSTHQVKRYIEEQLEKGKRLHKGFNQQNPVFDEDYIAVLDDVETEANFMITLNKTSKHMQQAKQQFKNIKYAVIMVMLCNSPYALAKYISCSTSYDPNVKSIRSFLSYAIKENVFKPFNILELGRRIFIILLETIRSRNPIQVVIQNYEGIGLQSDTDIEGYEPPKDKNTYEFLMWKSAEAFKKKKQALEAQMRKKGGSPVESFVEKSVRVNSELGDAKNTDQKDPYQYPFPEIDSDNEGGDMMDIEELKGKKKVKQSLKFDASMEMKNILQSQKRPHKLFLSTRGEVPNRVASSLSVSIRQHPYKTANTPAYDSNKDLKINIKQKPIFNDKLNDSESVNEKNAQCNTQRQLVIAKPLSARGGYRGESEPRHSVDSSPEILHTNTKAEDRVLEHMNELNIHEHPVQISRDKVSDEHDHSSIGQNYYAIQVKKVFDADQLAQMNKDIRDLDEPGIMVESTEFTSPNTAGQIAKQLIQNNKQALSDPLADYSLAILDNYSFEKKILVDVIRHLYRENSVFPNFQRVMKMIGQIVNKFPACQINPEIFSVIVKAQEAQAKTIPEIHFTELIPQNALCKDYLSKRHLFDSIYENLNKFVDSQNIYKVTQFIRRVFDNPDYEQQVTWDFILQLCDKIQYCEQQDMNWNMQKIQANLSKVSLSVWIRKFDNFLSKVLLSPFKDHLLEIFCNYLLTKQGNDEAIQFLTKVQEIDESQIVGQTLQRIQ